MHRRAVTLLSLLALVLAPGGLSGAVAWREALRQPAEWYAGPEAAAIAGSVVKYQTPEGGWPKNTDFAKPPSPEFLAETRPDHRAATIDNGGTTTPLTYLARVLSARPDAALHKAFDRGFDYLLAAQYPNGGWPQYYPLRPGYYTHITYNDNAMVNVLVLLREAAAGRAPYEFTTPEQRTKAAAAVEKGIACILRTQVKQHGKLTAWSAQHDEETFAVAPARNFEPASLSGAESVGIVKFLMEVEQPSPEIVAAIEGAVQWFQAVRISGLRVESFTGPNGKRDRRAVADAKAPAIWARFYELETDKPIFIGRDKIIRYDFNEIEQERRTGYVYLAAWPAGLLEKDYPRWRAKNKSS